MDIADIDESGTIDKSEFETFIKKLDKSTEDDKCNTIFDEAADGSEELSIEQFGKATFEALKDMEITKEEGADEEWKISHNLEQSDKNKSILNSAF